MFELDETWQTKRPNKYRIVGEVAYIQLTQGQEAIVDVDDLDNVLRYRWQAAWDASVGAFYAKSRVKRSDGKYSTINMHALLAGSVGKGGNLQADHINHDTLNNRRDNLRCVDSYTNQMNRNGARRESASGVRGVMPKRGADGSYRFWTFACYEGKRRKEKAGRGWGTCYHKSFPYTVEGLRQAVQLSAQHHRDVHGTKSISTRHVLPGAA